MNYPGTDTVTPQNLDAAIDSLETLVEELGCDSANFRGVVRDDLTRGGSDSTLNRIARVEFCERRFDDLPLDLQDYVEHRAFAEAAVWADLHERGLHHTISTTNVKRRVHRVAVEAGRLAA